MSSSFHEIVTDLLSERPKDGVRKLEAAARGSEPTPPLLSALRLAVQQPGQSTLYYHKLNNLWINWGRPALKPNVMQRKLLLLADSTVDGLAPLLSIFCAIWGIEVEVAIPTFDSIEQLALGQDVPGLSIDSETTVVLLPSERWLARYLGESTLVTEERLTGVFDLLESVLAGLENQGPRGILVGTVPPRTYPMPAGTVRHGGRLGWNLARRRINDWLAERQGPNLALVDLEEALFISGGRASLGQRSFFRAKIAFEQAGANAACWELASAFAQVCGKNHRAVVTDWDNTIWGGIVADDGALGVEIGLDSPEGLAYRRVQEYFQGLRPLGVLLAAVSRNDPKVCTIFEENSDMVLSLDDYSTVQVSFDPKSAAIGRASDDLGFGPEFMLFVDDSLFELVEALQVHPYLDVLRAGPDPEATLSRLAVSRYFNAVSLSDTDLERSKAAESLKKQREARGRFRSVEEFLGEIDIRLQIEGLTDQNLPRVVQMFEKTNQFNLTTRRHSKDHLLKRRAAGARFAVVSYQDSFGDQGIIAVLLLEPRDDELWIESWLMSCRVLNRTVEAATFGWAVEQADARPLVGEFLPTAKNGLVRSLYERCGMVLVERDPETGREVWRRKPDTPVAVPRHFATVKNLLLESELSE